MSLTIGIDLGTTNSLVAVPADADIPGKQELIRTGRLKPVGGALIVTDAYQAPLTPSVVWLEEDGTPVVGSLAKSKVKYDGQPPPAMFFKRTMGTDQRVTAGHASLTPQQASTYVLRRLKALAEEVLQAPVDQAVVTVPAYFEMRAKNETVQAGLDAGLAKVETLIEPFAAALMSTHEQQPDGPRTFLVYDLGGGTFDVSVVTWSPESGFEHLAFEGDRYLGGYEFDKAVVRWMAEQRPAYDLRLDPEEPEEARLLARLLVRVEAEKHFLSRETQTEIYVEGEADRAGIPMTIKLPFSRAEFEDLIRQDVQRTFDHCDAALQRAGLGPADLDEIVLVGGSSRVPMISRLLRERFGREPRLIDPDLCVAVGAGIKAGAAGVRQGVLEIDQVTATLPATDITGRVHPGEHTPAPGDLHVLLRSGDGVQSHRQETDAEGRFVFDDVALHDGDNELTITVVAGGKEIESRQITVAPGHEPPPTDEGDVLAHDFFVELAEGPYRIAEAGTKLPHHTDFLLETAGQGVLLRVRLHEGLIPIGQVDVDGLPSTLPAGTPLELELEFRPDWSIEAEVRIPSVGAQGRAVISVPREHVPSWDELQQQYLEVRSGWQERRAVARPEDAMRYGPRLDALLQECTALLNQRQDRAKSHHKLREAETLLGNIRLPGADPMHPPMPEFENKLVELAALCDDLARLDAREAQQHRESIPGLRAAGLAAYQSGNSMDWHSINQAVEDRCTAVRARFQADQPPPSPANIQLMLYRELEELDRALQDIDQLTEGRYRGRTEEFRAEVAGVVEAVGSVGTEDPQAVGRFAGIYRSQLQPLAARIERWMEEIKVGEPGVIWPRLPQAGGR
ncbi:Hsp70 family protein [Streptomyces sp. NBC_01808]|uniref:Hsp70 family protein n=1 Tax=Streptomyces sp. NBC_01808 TaxID=2975947 RepID=UPI002DD8344F|nr:Hsp70 family protein [Streptomyces sp. NBC_01808]WSA41652.1 Hsp70 family protein [Streptomyces sp. NBC_01808]